MDPAMPSTITNRDADNWRPLLAIADAAGGEWAVRARPVAETMTDKTEGDEQSLKTVLLEDIRTRSRRRASTSCRQLNWSKALLGMKDQPWPELGRAVKPITQNKLAALLRTTASIQTTCGLATSR